MGPIAVWSLAELVPDENVLEKDTGVVLPFVWPAAVCDLHHESHTRLIYSKCNYLIRVYA